MNRTKMIGLAPVPGLCESRIDDLRYIKAAGFEATFFNWKQGETTAWKREADKLGLFVQSIHAPFSRSGGCLVSHLWNEGEEGVAARGNDALHGIGLVGPKSPAGAETVYSELAAVIGGRHQAVEGFVI